MTSAEAGSWTAVAAVDELRAAGRLERLVGRKPVLLIWQDEAPLACAALCPHAFAPLCEGEVRDGRIHCARHQASFDLATGDVDSGWRLPPLAIYPARVNAGQVEICI